MAERRSARGTKADRDQTHEGGHRCWGDTTTSPGIGAHAARRGALAGEEFLAASRPFEMAPTTASFWAVQKRTGKRPSGFELHEHRAAAARRVGYDVTSDPRQIPDRDLDLIWSIAVLEHVASPSRFSRRGTLVLAVPTQDVPSTDLLFIDHLWHFHTPHMSVRREVRF
jgi:hypothetical protein